MTNATMIETIRTKVRNQRCPKSIQAAVLYILALAFLSACQGTKSADAYLGLGNAAADRGDHKTAIAHLTEAINLDPGNAEAFNSRAFCHFNSGEYHKAIEDYSEALRLEPELGVAYYWRSQAYTRTGQNEKAAADLESLRRLVPNPPET